MNSLFPKFRFSRQWLRSIFILLLAAFPLSAADAPAAELAGDEVPAPLGIRISELGCLRVMLVLDYSSGIAEKRVARLLTDYDFRVFPTPLMTGKLMNSACVKVLAETEQADLVVWASVELHPKASLEDLKLFEGEATVQMWNACSGELIASETSRVLGPRTSDALRGQRDALEQAVDAATATVLKKSLAKAHRVLVHEAAIVNVFSENSLLEIMQYMERMEGVFQVRRLAFDRAKNEALIEIVSSPKTEAGWHAYLEKLPRSKVQVQLKPKAELHAKYPSWFQPSSSN